MAILIKLVCMLAQWPVGGDQMYEDGEPLPVWFIVLWLLFWWLVYSDSKPKWHTYKTMTLEDVHRENRKINAHEGEVFRESPKKIAKKTSPDDSSRTSPPQSKHVSTPQINHIHNLWLSCKNVFAHAAKLLLWVVVTLAVFGLFCFCLYTLFDAVMG